MKNKKRLPYLLASLFIIVVVIIGCRITLYRSADYEMIDLNDSWLMSINNSDFHEVSMWDSYKYFEGELKHGDHII